MIGAFTEPHRSCACGFDLECRIWPRYGVEWHRLHMWHHLHVFPDVDRRTRDNLANFTEMAKQREEAAK